MNLCLWTFNVTTHISERVIFFLQEKDNLFRYGLFAFLWYKKYFIVVAKLYNLSIEVKLLLIKIKSGKLSQSYTHKSQTCHYIFTFAVIYLQILQNQKKMSCPNKVDDSIVGFCNQIKSVIVMWTRGTFMLTYVQRLHYILYLWDREFELNLSKVSFKPILPIHPMSFINVYDHFFKL